MSYKDKKEIQTGGPEFIVELRGVPPCRSVFPLASVLQIETTRNAAHCMFLFLTIPYESKLSTGLLKQKHPLRGALFLLVRGAAGIRTPVQTGNQYVFYMLSLSLVVGQGQAKGHRSMP